MKVVFRTDASFQIGTGHVMRCLTLADSLRELGAQCTFICREHQGNLLALIEQRKYKTIALPAPNIKHCEFASSPARTAWLGADWFTDAQQTRQALGSNVPNWLVVDHYAIDRRWEKAVRTHAKRLMVIDDLADRQHDCDLLLDQNLGRTEQDYGCLLPAHVRSLVGPQYALLRPEFAEIRAESLARRANPQLHNLLITMGGVDKENATGQVLDALKEFVLPQDLRITVVMGPHAPWLAQVKARAEKFSRPTQVLVGVSNMARLMADSDLAIGAAGGTAWERCCLGLPSLVLVIAENQRAGAVALHNANAAILLDACHQIASVISGWQPKQLQDSMLRMSHAAAAVTDGSGSVQIAKQMLDSYV